MPRIPGRSLVGAWTFIGFFAVSLFAEEIVWEDPGMEFAVRRALERQEGPIFRAEIAGLERLNANADRFLADIPRIASLADLRHATSLEFLDVAGHGMGDEAIAFLAELPRLKWLYVSGNDLAELDWISGLHNLQWFSAIGNRIASAEPLAGLPQLRRLFLGVNEIENVRPLAEIPALTHLYLERNRLADISPLAQLEHLRVLSINFNRVRSFSAFEGHGALRELYFVLNHLHAVEDTASIPNLQWLDVRFNFLDLSEETPQREWFISMRERVPAVFGEDQGTIWIKAQATTADGAWVYSEWMGHVYRAPFWDTGWSWVLGIGWVWTERFSVPDGLWFYSAEDQDYYFTGDLIAPMAYRQSDGQWVHWIPVYYEE